MTPEAGSAVKTAVIVLADGFEEVEAVTPLDLLRRAGVRVVLAGLAGTTVTGARGLRVLCDTVLDQVVPGWDALILPGGMPGALHLSQSPLVSRCLGQAFAQGAWVGAICAAPVLVLGTQGFLKGRRYTGYPGTGPGVETGGVEVGEGVVVDGRLITSRGVGTAGAFALALVEALAGPESAQRVAQAVLWGDGPIRSG